MNRRKTNFFLIMFLTMAAIQTSHAQSPQTQEWANWNAESPPYFPAEKWMQYETPEEAGWSSERLSEVLNSFLIHEQWSIPYCFAD